MSTTQDSTRFLRIAAWIWIGYLIAMAVMDFALYTPQVQRIVLQSESGQQQVQPLLPNQLGQPNNQPINPLNRPRNYLAPVYLFYAANSFVALLFLLFAHWDDIQKKSRKFLLSAFAACHLRRTHHHQRACRAALPARPALQC